MIHFLLLIASLRIEDDSIITVAVKAPKMCLLTQGIVTDFYEEAKTTISLRHENIVRCLGFSSEPHELPSLIFEYMDHGSLEEILATNRANNVENDRLLKLTDVRPFTLLSWMGSKHLIIDQLFFYFF